MNTIIEKGKSILQKNSKIVIVILACLVTLSISLSIDNNFGMDSIKEDNNFLKVLIYINKSIKREPFKSLFVFGSMYVLLKRRFIDDADLYKKSKLANCLSVLMSVSMVFGYSYVKTNSWYLVLGGIGQVTKAFIKGVGYFIIFKVFLDYVFNILFEKIKYKQSTNKVFNFIFEKHSFIMPFLIIVICWIPYLVFYYPGGLVPDSCNQIKQFYGMDIAVTSSTNSTNLIDDSMKITNHHSAAHTVILGSCVKLGQNILNFNFGVFIYTVLQFFVLSLSLAYMISYMKKIKANNIIRFISLLIFAIHPIFPFYAIEITKDTLFTALMILYVIQIDKFIRVKNNKKIDIRDIFISILLCIFICMIRNNGIYIIMLSYPFIAVFSKENRRRLLISSAIILIAYIVYMNVILPIFKIPGTGVREMLSIPFQQTARYVNEHEEEVSIIERKAIDNVLEYDTLKERYKPEIADPVKNNFNKNSSKEDLKKYFEVWMNQLKKHPTTYIESFINNYYGYFYIEKGITSYTSVCVVNHCATLKNVKEFNYHYSNKFIEERKVINQLLIASKDLPIVSWITNIGMNSWILMIMATYLIYKRKYRFIVLVLPNLVTLLICFASPVNAYFRYAMPYIFTLPLVFSSFIDLIKPENEIKE